MDTHFIEMDAVAQIDSTYCIEWIFPEGEDNGNFVGSVSIDCLIATREMIDTIKNLPSTTGFIVKQKLSETLFKYWDLRRTSQGNYGVNYQVVFNESTLCECYLEMYGAEFQRQIDEQNREHEKEFVDKMMGA